MEHEAGNLNCEACRRGFPVPCDCGGLIHAGKGCVISAECDKCNEPDEQIEKAATAADKVMGGDRVYSCRVCGETFEVSNVADTSNLLSYCPQTGRQESLVKAQPSV
jgi:hypothetical protein